MVVKQSVEIAERQVQKHEMTETPAMAMADLAIDQPLRQTGCVAEAPQVLLTFELNALLAIM